MSPSRIALAAFLLAVSAPPCGLVSGCATQSIAAHPAPDFNLPALDGSTLTLASLKGSVALVDFWASWCGPCREELPELERLKAIYEPRGVRFVTVNLDSDRNAAAAMARQLGLTMPVGLDDSKNTADAFKVPTMPSSFVLDRAGIVRFVHEGYYGSSDLARFKTELDSLLAPSPTSSGS